MSLIWILIALVIKLFIDALRRERAGQIAKGIIEERKQREDKYAHMRSDNWCNYNLHRYGADSITHFEKRADGHWYPKKQNVEQ